MAEFDRDSYVKDQILELYRWSKEEHERRFCAPAFVWYRHYKNYVDLRLSPDDYKANFGVGIAYPTVELIVARCMEPWLQGDELIKCRSAEPEGESVAPRIGALINDTVLNRFTRPMSKLNLTKKSAIALGRGVLKFYNRQPRPMSLLQRTAIKVGRSLVPGGIRLGSFLGRQDVTPPSQLEIDYTDPFQFWMTPGYRFIEEAEWTFEDIYLTTSEAHAKMESKEWRDFDLDDAAVLGYDNYRSRRQQLEAGLVDHIYSHPQERRPHRLIEFQGRVQVKESKGSRPKYEDRIVQILNENVVAKTDLLATWNGKPSYIVWEPTLDPVSHRGIGIIEPGEDMLLAINDFANIIVDNLRKLVESPLLLDPTMTDQKTLYLGPGEINLVRQPMYAVKALEMKDIPGSAFNFLGWFNDLWQRITGVSDFFGGLNTSDTDKLTKTATGMNLMASLSASRFGPMLASMDRDLYRRLAIAIHETKRQRSDAIEMVRMAGPNSPFAAVSPDDLERHMDFTFNTKALDPSSDQNREKFLAMTEQLIALTEPLSMQGKGIDVYELARIMMQEFDRGGDVDRIIKGLQELAAQAQAGMAPGAMPGGMPAGIPGLPPGSPMAGIGAPALPGRPSPIGPPQMLPAGSAVSPEIPPAVPLSQVGQA